MKYKVGDTVRIQSREWIDAQEKSGSGSIGVFCIGMKKYAGKTAVITKVGGNNDIYQLDVDDEFYFWCDEMFDPNYRPGEPLSPEDAIRAMFDGETLHDDAGRKYWWEKEDSVFRCLNPGAMCSLLLSDVRELPSLYRRPKKRPWTVEEFVRWAISEESVGWFVRWSNGEGTTQWRAAHNIDVVPNMEFIYYQRARLFPNLSGVDPATIQGFEEDEE
jgi:hypothetical protein